MRTHEFHSDSGGLREVYVTLAAGPGDSAEAIFAAGRDAVARHSGRIWHQRAFVPSGQWQAWRSAMGDDAPLTHCLDAGAEQEVGGLQIHAIAGECGWTALGNGDGPSGWMIEHQGWRWAATGGLLAADRATGPEQTQGAFERAEALLRPIGMGLQNVARTWIFLDRILDWYTPFNHARNALFIERGLLKRGADTDASRVPASTGMGLAPVPLGRLSLEVFAAMVPPGESRQAIERYAAAGKQRSAYEYGAAFARGSTAITPAGKTVFVSGTAAIDAAGSTCFVNDPVSQIRMTMENVLAVLCDTGADLRSVVQAIAYCKNPEVARIFNDGWGREVDWPWIVAHGDVCREDLLFEVEATALIPA